MSADRKLIRIHSSDNVGVAVCGEWKGHKFALRAISAGEPVIKYGFQIGVALRNIVNGEHVHTHNMRSCLNAQSNEYAYTPFRQKTDPNRNDSHFFYGFKRPDGRVGIRNDIWIIPLVGCVNGLARHLAELAPCHPLPLCHPYGCSQLGDDHENTVNLLAALALHPNAGGVLVLSLGCENNTMESFKARLGDISSRNIRFLVAQESSDEISDGLRLIDELEKNASENKRISCSFSNLVIGFKCGASDGFSGITANAVVGCLADCMDTWGTNFVLSEVPEMFGAEEILLRRCVNEDVFHQAVAMIQNFKKYFTRHGQPVGENPSPGNKAGGITTLEEKSLGCVQKGGKVPVVQTLKYAERLEYTGHLTLLQAPGNDMVSSTALAAAGCQMVLFTTGRGTPWGTVVPTIKISSNSALAVKKNKWIDFDAGRILDGMTATGLAMELTELVVRTANSEYFAKNEQNNNREIAIFKDGVTL